MCWNSNNQFWLEPELVHKIWLELELELFRNAVQVEPSQSSNHWTLDLPENGKFQTVGGPQTTYIHVLTLHYAVQV